MDNGQITKDGDLPNEAPEQLVKKTSRDAAQTEYASQTDQQVVKLSWESFVAHVKSWEVSLTSCKRITGNAGRLALLNRQNRVVEEAMHGIAKFSESNREAGNDCHVANPPPL
ncbi:hypothetical protein AURDEDRAFT_176915 [Auricularia subglabra TFB-10046 SS5]|uniref:Uncharacterized protein n=1 Tax=Auricularia subglabra (strain TFB-10046 / SS5) TaxID=717982 RepID=J0WNS6_AURST|nr:hypothetical protein AURDEDRAFT_176915 [Auricularia subglabra TFB-10046 SS5]